MNVGFESKNLDAAVAVVMALAKKNNQKTIVTANTSESKLLSLTDVDQVRDYLISSADFAYQKALKQNAAGGIVGRISDVPYLSVGVVFENMPDEIRPEPITRSEVRPAHLAFFWQHLG